MINREELIYFLKSNNFDFVQNEDNTIDFTIQNQLFNLVIKSSVIDLYIKTTSFSIWQIDYYHSLTQLQEILLALKFKEKYYIQHLSFCSGFFILNDNIFFLTTRGCREDNLICCMGWKLGNKKIDPLYEKMFNVKHHYQIREKELNQIITAVSIDINPALEIIKIIEK